MCQSLSLLLLTVLSLSLTTVSITQELFCKESERCICSADEWSFSYNCSSKINHYEVLNISDYHCAVVECDGTKSSEIFNNLPKLNLPQLDKIEFEQCLFTQESLINFTAPSIDTNNINWLRYTVTDIQNIPITRNHFRGLTKLTYLRLYDMSQTSLPDDLFEDLVEITWLIIFAEVEFLPPGIFKRLTKLKDLGLSMPLTNLDNFQWIDTIWRFGLNGLRLNAFPTDLFANRSDLTKVFLTNSLALQHTTLSEDMFKNSRRIKDIDLSGNYLKRIPKRLFHSQENLWSVSFKNNCLTQLEDDRFLSNEYLYRLDLSYNKFVTISRTFSLCFIDLKTLLMNNNFIETVDIEVFAYFEKLEEFNLSNNNIKSLFTFVEPRVLMQPVYSFGVAVSTKNFKNLYLSNNIIKKITADDIYILLNSLRLQYVDLRSNPIERITYDSEVYKVKDSSSVQRLEAVLGSSSFICDCHVGSLLHYYWNKAIGTNNEYSSRVDLKMSEITCGNTTNLWGRRFVDLNQIDLTCALNQNDVCPSSCTCLNRTIDRTLLINCSGLDLEEVPSLPNITSLDLDHIEIDLSFNKIKHLPLLRSIARYDRVTKLTLNDNHIEKVTFESIPKSLKELHLKNNNLATIDKSTLDSLTLNKISLSGNPWKCTCDSLEFLQFIQSEFKTIVDYEDLKCSNQKIIKNLGEQDFCPTTFTWEIVGGSILILLAILVACATVLYFKFNYEIKVWFFARGWCMCLIDEDDLDEDMKYDAFVAYTLPDQDFLIDHLVPQLETGEYPYRLCLHERDWIPGLPINVQYRQSVVESRKTIIILSKNFLNSYWGLAEFGEANSLAIKERRPRVIIIMYEDVGPIDQLSQEMQTYIKLNTYLKWGDEKFWQKLKFALRNPISMRKTKKGRKNIAETVL